MIPVRSIYRRQGRLPIVSQCRRPASGIRTATTVGASSAPESFAVPGQRRGGLDPDPDTVEAVVVGGGPAGLLVVGNLLELLRKGQRILWVDPLFASGRIGARYREVPSNTKASLFVQYFACLEPFRHIVAKAPSPNAATALERLSPEEGCSLGYAADLCSMLTRGLGTHFSGTVPQHRGMVTSATLDKLSNVWSVGLDTGKVIRTRRVALCTGSSPTVLPLSPTLSMPGANQAYPQKLDLDTCLAPSLLGETIDPTSAATVAVVGASHSAILCLMNLYQLAATTHPQLRIKWFTRHTHLRYAKEMDGWTLYDNTGLKLKAADWARTHLEGENFHNSPVSKTITRLWQPPNEEAENRLYDQELPGCSHVVQAIGYRRDPLPQLSMVEQDGALPTPLILEHDQLTGRFFNGREKSETPVSEHRAHIPGLFGGGIAFPERITDPHGNVENSVGLWKFKKFFERVVPEWSRTA